MSNGHFFWDLSIGQTASFAKTITSAGVPRYSAINMDTNPIQFGAEAAKHTDFGARNAHGMPPADVISGVPGTLPPGPGAHYMRQSSRLAATANIGQTVKAMSLNPDKKRATWGTVCPVGDEPVIEGEATVRAPSHG